MLTMTDTTPAVPLTVERYEDHTGTGSKIITDLFPTVPSVHLRFEGDHRPSAFRAMRMHWTLGVLIGLPFLGLVLLLGIGLIVWAILRARVVSRARDALTLLWVRFTVCRRYGHRPWTDDAPGWNYCRNCGARERYPYKAEYHQ